MTSARADNTSAELAHFNDQIQVENVLIIAHFFEIHLHTIAQAQHEGAIRGHGQNATQIDHIITLVTVLKNTPCLQQLRNVFRNQVLLSSLTHFTETLTVTDDT